VVLHLHQRSPAQYIFCLPCLYTRAPTIPVQGRQSASLAHIFTCPDDLLVLAQTRMGLPPAPCALSSSSSSAWMPVDLRLCCSATPRGSVLSHCIGYIQCRRYNSKSSVVPNVMVETRIHYCRQYNSKSIGNIYVSICRVQ
jgi:hypothetical protein